MSPQKYSNHTKSYAPHHLFVYPVGLIGIVFSIRQIFTHPENSLEWGVISLLWIMMMVLSLMLRQHYALGNQDRIVRMEMRFRYYVLTQQRLEELEDKLTFRQIAALRFAPDEELPALVKRAVNENLSPVEIKKAVKNWLADDMRV